MKSNKEICFICPTMGPILARDPSCGVGGAERQFYIFGTELAKRGWSVSFYIKKVGALRELPSNVRVVQFGMRHFGGAKLYFLLDILSVAWTLILKHPSHVVIKTAPQFCASVLLAKFVRRIRLIVWGQMSTSFDWRVPGAPMLVEHIRRAGIRHAAVSIAQTQYQLRRLKSFFGRDGKVVNNVLQMSDWLDEGGVEFNIRCPYILWVGNATLNKRFEILLSLAKAMPERFFVVAMNGVTIPKFSAYKTEAEKLGNVRFCGSVPSDKMGSLYAKCELIVNTAIREGFPNTYLQAWQYGKPVISVNVNPDGIIGEFGLGRCVYDDASHLKATADQIALRVRAVLEEMLPKVAEYRERCRKFVSERHSADACVSSLIRVLEGVA